MKRGFLFGGIAFYWAIKPKRPVNQNVVIGQKLKLMNKLTTIKYGIYRVALNLPKYIAFLGLICSSVLPLKALAADSELISPAKPALFALAETPMPTYSFDQTWDRSADIFTLINGSTLAVQMNPIFVDQTEARKITKYEDLQTLVGSTPLISETRRVITTAYSSTIEQTDNSPFITATGSHVRDGIVACNFLKFGTRVRFPDYFGDKIFVVEDRMALRNSHKIDIWMPSRELAMQFGVRNLNVEILEN
jgi:3D (Asp-Asp-Asp) domain-containing protein